MRENHDWRGKGCVATTLAVIGVLVLESCNLGGESSTAGIVWTKQTSGVSTLLSGVASSGSMHVAVGENVLSSSDGINWHQRDSGLASSSVNLVKVIWADKQFVAVGYRGTIITSPDGITWTVRHRDPLSDSHLYDVAWSGSKFVAVGFRSGFWESLDGVSWSKVHDLELESTLFGITWTGKQFVAVGGKGSRLSYDALVLTSLDGASWLHHPVVAQCWNSSGCFPLKDAAWTGSKLVAVGNHGLITSSDGGVSWELVISIPNVGISSVAWSGSKLVTVGGGGKIMTSSDGSSWTEQSSGTAKHLLDVIWTGKMYIAVGSDGIILTSE